MSEIKKYNPDLKENLIVTLTFQHALEIIKFVELLENNRKFAVANQLVRSGTSIGANVREAEETEYWLEICNQSENYPDCSDLLNQILSIKVLSKIISSSKTS